MFLNLATNKLTGTIPTELGNLLLMSTYNSHAPIVPIVALLFCEACYGLLTLVNPTCLHSRIERIRLTINELDGPIPSELGRLTVVDALGLGRNYLTGTIPKEMGQMVSMTELGMEENNLNGTIPVELGGLQEMSEFSFAQMCVPFSVYSIV